MLSAQALKARLGATDGRPAILRQKFNNLGPHWSEARDGYLQAYPMQDSKFLTQDKMDALTQWMGAAGYRIVWQNEWFALYEAD